MELAPLLAWEGQRVIAEGFLIQGENGLAGISFLPLEPSYLAQFPGGVGLPLTSGDGVRLPVGVRAARVYGTWDGERIVANEAVVPPERDVTGEFYSSDEAGEVQVPSLVAGDSALNAALDESLANGNLIGTGVEVGEDGELALLIAAHDAAALRAAVAGFPRCRVVQSPWDRATYRRVRAFWKLAAEQNVLHSLTVGVNDDGHSQTRIELLRLTPELVERGAGIAEGPMPLRLLMWAEPS